MPPTNRKDTLSKVPDRKKGVALEDCLPRIEKLVNFYMRTFDNAVLKESYEDMFQEAVLQILKTKYLERYDYSRSIHTYLSGFIYNLFCHVHKRGMSVVSQAESIESCTPNTNLTLLSRIGVSDLEVDDTLECEKISSVLLEQSCKFYTVYDDTMHFVEVTEFPQNYPTHFLKVPHSASTIFRLLRTGMPASEIRKTLKMTIDTYNTEVAKLTSTPELVSWAEAKGFKVLKKPT